MARQHDLFEGAVTRHVDTSISIIQITWPGLCVSADRDQRKCKNSRRNEIKKIPDRRSGMNKFLLGVAVAAVSALAWSSAAPAQTKLLVNSFLPPQHVVKTQALDKWAADVERATNGRVVVEFPAKSLAPPSGQWELVTQGIADVAYIFNGFAQRRLLLPAVVHLPFGSTNAEAMSVALWRTYKEYFETADEYKGVKLLALFTAPAGELYSMKDPITSMQDLGKMKMWALPGVPSRAMEQSGAAVVSGPAVRIYEIVSRGTVDGYVGIPFVDALAFNALDFAKSTTEIPGNIFSPSFSFFMNIDKWNSLSREDQDAIESVSGEALARRIGAVWDLKNVDAMNQLDDKGIERISPSRSFVDAMRKQWAFLEDEWIENAKTRGIDGRAALAFYRRQAQDLAN